MLRFCRYLLYALLVLKQNQPVCLFMLHRSVTCLCLLQELPVPMVPKQRRMLIHMMSNAIALLHAS